MDKLNGFLGIRADLQFRIQTNSQPFQAGRLIIAWLPYYKYLGNKRLLFDENTEASFTSLTALPHVELDLATETEATLHVPFVSPNMYYNLVTGEGYYGKLYIKVYSPLADVSGSGNVDCTIWFNYSNVRLAFPTGAPTASSSVNPIAQVGHEESDLESKRSVSLALAKFSSALRALPAVPTLTAIAEPAAWVSDQASAICKYFGFSKVESSNVPQWLKQGPTHFMANYDGCNMSHSLALESQNAVETMSGMVGTDIDEMSIAHIVATPCYYTHFQWSTTNANGDILYSQTISPLVFRVDESASNTNVPSLLTFTTAAFAYWRGSIDLKFKFIKTKFHSGRVRIYFQPGISATLNSPRANFNYSQVVDLRSEDVVSFRVPYVSTKPWLWTRNSQNSNFGYDITGTVFIEVLNELRAVSTVTSSIDVLVEVSGGPDYELAAPSQNLFQPVSISSSPSSSILSRIRAKAQSGEEATREEEQTPLNKDQLGSKDVFKHLWPNNLFTMGEKITSVRQLIKRAATYGTLSTPTNQWVLYPWRMLGTYSRTSNGAKNPQSFAPLDYFSRIFVFGRGGINFKLIPRTANQSRAIVKATVSYPSNVTLNSTVLYEDTASEAVSYLQNGATQVIINDLEGCIDFYVPYYSNYHMFPISDLIQDAANEDLGVFPPVKVTVSNQGGDCDLYRSAADSFQFGYLIGAPRCESLQFKHLPN
uniref:Structural polyprotein n=1 Tax=Bundaberg bee virus 1 TaxID=2201284 RepID=A0A2U8JQ81_9VIRU|nr:structural polyprotein [Bundaberg bee virus 1]